MSVKKRRSGLIVSQICGFFVELIFKAQGNGHTVITAERTGKKRPGVGKKVLRPAHHLGKMGQPQALCLCLFGKPHRLAEGTVTVQKGLILLTVLP